MIESINTSAFLSAAAYARWDRAESEIKDELINNRQNLISIKQQLLTFSLHVPSY